MTMVRSLAAVGVVACMAVAPQVRADEDAWLPGNSAHGVHGIHHVDSARPPPRGELALTLGGEAYVVDDIFVPGDSDVGQTYTLRLAWAPIGGLQLGAGGTFLSNVYTSFGHYTIRVVGNPSLFLRGAVALLPRLSLGLLAQGTMPTSADNGAIEPAALAVKLAAAATFHVGPWLEVSANLGYVYDQGRRQFSAPPSPERRLALQVSDFNTLTAGAAAQALFSPVPELGVAPFVEADIATAGLSADRRGSARASVGVKLFPPPEGLVEVALGLDIRLMGGPNATARFAPLPPWTAFAQVALHLFTAAPGTSGGMGCSRDTDCTAARVCREQRCVELREVTVAPVEVGTYVIEGRVQDSSDGAPVRQAEVRIDDIAGAFLPVNRATGAFTSFPLPTDRSGVTLKITAEGYEPTRQVVLAAAAGGRATVVVSLTKSLHLPQATLKGVVLGARTGKPIAGAKVSIPALPLSCVTNTAGNFSLAVRPGQYDVLVAAHGFVTQQRRVTLEDKETVPLNLDLSPVDHPRRPHR